MSCLCCCSYVVALCRPNNRCLLTAVVLMSVFVSECESTTVLIDDIPVLLYVILHSRCVKCLYMDNLCTDCGYSVTDIMLRLAMSNYIIIFICINLYVVIS